MRPDMIGPRRLRPASDGSHSEPLFQMVREDPHRVLKGIVIPSTVRGAVQGVMPGVSAPPKPQPFLWVMEKAVGEESELPIGLRPTPPGKFKGALGSLKHQTHLVRQWQEAIGQKDYDRADSISDEHSRHFLGKNTWKLPKSKELGVKKAQDIGRHFSGREYTPGERSAIEGHRAADQAAITHGLDKPGKMTVPDPSNTSMASPPPEHMVHMHALAAQNAQQAKPYNQKLHHAHDRAGQMWRQHIGSSNPESRDLAIQATQGANKLGAAHESTISTPSSGALESFKHSIGKGYPLGEGPRGSGLWPQPPPPEKKQEPKKIDLGTAPQAKKSQQEMIPGGLASGKPDTAFDPEALEAGMKVELEHSGNAKLAREIARDHLTEDPNYYKKLAKMEAKKAMSELVKKAKEAGGKKRSWMPPTEYGPEAYGKPAHPEGTGPFSGEPIEKIKARLGKYSPSRDVEGAEKPSK